MKASISKTNGQPANGARKKAVRLLDWLVDFLPTAIPTSLEEAILDEQIRKSALLLLGAEKRSVYGKKNQASRK